MEYPRMASAWLRSKLTWRHLLEPVAWMYCCLTLWIAFADIECLLSSTDCGSESPPGDEGFHITRSKRFRRMIALFIFIKCLLAAMMFVGMSQVPRQRRKALIFFFAVLNLVSVCIELGIKLHLALVSPDPPLSHDSRPFPFTMPSLGAWYIIWCRIFDFLRRERLQP